MLGETAAAAGKTDTFLGERYRRLARRRGKLKALVAIRPFHPGHRLAPPRRPRHPLPGSRRRLPRSRIDKNRKTRNHVRQFEALGYTVALTQAA